MGRGEEAEVHPQRNIVTRVLGVYETVDVDLWPVDPVQFVAFLTALATVAITYAVGSSFGGVRSGSTLVLAGVAVVSFVTAVQTFILQRNLDVVREVFNWILGRFTTAWPRRPCGSGRSAWARDWRRGNARR